MSDAARFAEGLLSEGRVSPELEAFADRLLETLSLTYTTHPPETHQLAATRLLRLLMAEMGGNVYIPPVGTYDRLLRDRAIRSAFTGANVSELATRHGLSPDRIRQIVGMKKSGKK
jgi:Mor family transcriptional regulator